MGMPYRKINIGDVFQRHRDALEWDVVDKCDGMIQIRSVIASSELTSTLWKKPSDMIFTRRILEARAMPISRPLSREKLREWLERRQQDNKFHHDETIHMKGYHAGVCGIVGGILAALDAGEFDEEG